MARANGLEPVKPIYGPLPNARRERLAQLLASGVPQAEAHAKAGYEGRSATSVYAAVNCDPVRGRVRGIQEKAEQITINAIAVTRDEIIESLRETRAMAKEGTPVLAKDGSETGVCKPDLSAKNRADETLAKMHGMLLDVQKAESLDSELEHMEPDDIQTLVVGLMEKLDPNLRKNVEAMLVKRAQEQGPTSDDTLQ